MSIASTFTPDHRKYEGVRPINIYLLRALYFLMAAFIATQAWSTILSHPGPWDHVQAVAWCVWATYTTLSLLGLLHPLRMLPIVVFMIGYKLLWLVVVAYPLWRAGTLIGSPAEEMARVFVWAPLTSIAVPWGYFLRNYVMWPRSDRRGHEPQNQVAHDGDREHPRAGAWINDTLRSDHR